MGEGNITARIYMYRLALLGKLFRRILRAFALIYCALIYLTYNLSPTGAFIRGRVLSNRNGLMKLGEQRRCDALNFRPGRREAAKRAETRRCIYVET